jgi:delta1-piperideine-2-carboxylate reductase
MTPSGNDVCLRLDEVRDLAYSVLNRAGCDEDNADAIADTIFKAERDGAHAHGLFRLPGYVASLKSGKVDGRARPVWERIAPSVLRVDGANGYAPLALRTLRDPLVELADSQGIAAAALIRTHHFAPLWVEVEAIAERGLAALACTAYKPAIPPAGGAKPVYGTNPLAFAWPRPGGDPMVFDQASAVMSRGDVMIAARDGRPLPEGVGIDARGRPTTDAGEVLKGAILPFGGYKGAAIALMIELLVGPLIGERTSPEAKAADLEDGGPPRGGEFILAIAPSRFGNPGGWADKAEALFKEILAQEGVRLPGDGRRARRARILKEGVTVPGDLYRTIRDLT